MKEEFEVEFLGSKENMAEVITNMQILTLKKSDVLVIRANTGMMPDNQVMKYLEKLKKTIEKILPNVTLLICNKDIEISVLRQEQ